ncbi:unnamed protein product [Effrenium voratum]|uniref:Uncharacterized protein n=1 Tax=Effrenium voratum TaxID=2562239 RepID=A0AA36MPW1_9DINO|nr:unnamed protein product [Effrenium voratum]
MSCTSCDCDCERQPRSLADATAECRDLEHATASLFHQLDPDRLAALQRRCAQLLLQRQAAAARFPPAQRARRVAERELEATSQELSEVLASNRQLEKDLQGLHRTWQKLQGQLSQAQLEAQQSTEAMHRLDEEDADLLLAHQRLDDASAALHSEHETLAQQVAAERQKRMELKAACRHQIAKVEESKIELQRGLEKQEPELAAAREVLKCQRASTEEVLANLARVKAEVDKAEAEASQLLNAKHRIHEEWMQAQKQHGQLKDALEQTTQRLKDLAKEESQALSDWRHGYLQNLDEKIRRRKLRQSAVSQVTTTTCKEPLTISMAPTSEVQ